MPHRLDIRACAPGTCPARTVTLWKSPPRLNLIQMKQDLQDYAARSTYGRVEASEERTLEAHVFADAVTSQLLTRTLQVAEINHQIVSFSLFEQCLNLSKPQLWLILNILPGSSNLKKQPQQET